MLDVDKSIPIPDVVRSKKSKYPFSEMEVGDSFLYKPGTPPLHKSHPVQHISAIAVMWAKKRGGKIKFSCRTVEGGVRVWRVE